MEFFIEVRAEKRRVRMTKGQLVRAMKDLDDDAQIYIYCTSSKSEMDVGAFAYDIYLDDVSTTEMTIIAHF